LTWLSTIVLAISVLQLPAVTTPAGARAAAGQPFSDAAGLHVVTRERVDARLFAITVTTAALPRPAHLRVLLPSGYGDRPGLRYPVLYLLHGTSGGAADWTKVGDAERTTAGVPVIGVMPDIGLDGDGGGWCADWLEPSRYGKPRWETFHIRQLVPWVEANLPAVRSRQGRAIAGLSQGGYCAISYAARHPDLFGVARSYSGLLDTSYDRDARTSSTAVINYCETRLNNVAPNTIFGDRASHEINWENHDPATLANNLRGTDIAVYTGNGRPGPLDPTPPDPSAVGIERALIRNPNVEFHRRLVSLAIPHHYDDYGPGTHSWPYWARDLRRDIEPITAAFEHPVRRSRQVTYSVADPSYSIYGWKIALRRSTSEFSTLANADSDGFSLRGSGSGRVVTPPDYLPGSRHTITVRGDRAKKVVTRIADSAGRLHIDVPLGPRKSSRHYAVGSAVNDPGLRTAWVTVEGG
jgi:S-formylglutathione hydrolase FrmB